MEIVVPVRRLANLLVDTSAFYCRARNKRLLQTPLTLTDAGSIIKAMVSDELSRRLRWTTPNDEAVSVLTRVIPEYQHESTHNIHRQFRTDVLAYVEGVIEQLFAEFVGERSWYIWSLKPVPSPFLRHEEDVYQRLTEDTLHPIRHLGNGRYEMLVLKAGEVALATNGEPILLARRGDVVRDPTTRQPVVDPVADAVGDMILERGEDFRIYEWERLLEAGAIDYSHFTAADYQLSKEPATQAEFEQAVHTDAERSQISDHQRRIQQQVDHLVLAGLHRGNVAGYGVPKLETSEVKAGYVRRNYIPQLIIAPNRPLVIPWHRKLAHDTPTA